MTLVLPTAETAGLSFPGQAVLDATDLQVLINALGDTPTGVVNGCAVSTPGSGGTYTIAIAAGAILSAGAYKAVAAVTNYAIPTASATDRRDIVCSDATGAVTITQGTACGTLNWTTSSGTLPPVKPAIPGGSVLLGEIYVPGTATSIASGNIIDKTLIVTEPDTGGIFGDGSDGAVTLDGVATVLGMAPYFGNYTMTRDMYFTNLTFTGNATLSLGGFRLFVNGTLTGPPSLVATINAQGLFGTGAAPPIAYGAAIVSGGAASANTGTATTAGSAAGGTTTNNLGGIGGAGGTGNGGGNAAGAATGALTAPAAALGTPRHVPNAIQAGAMSATTTTFTPFLGGTSGSQGGGGGTGNGIGGYGGLSGGVVVVVARFIASTVTINADGTAGGPGAGTGSGNAGGGGGGGGGLCIVVSSTPKAPTTHANGGAGGAKTGNGVAGSAGAAGTVILIQA